VVSILSLKTRMYGTPENWTKIGDMLMNLFRPLSTVSGFPKRSEGPLDSRSFCIESQGADQVKRGQEQKIE
jgi:hypothetical protein